MAFANNFNRVNLTSVNGVVVSIKQEREMPELEELEAVYNENKQELEGNGNDPIQLETITGMEFSGAGQFSVTQERVKSNLPFTVSKNGNNRLVFKTKPTNNGYNSGGSLFNLGNVSIGSVSGNGISIRNDGRDLILNDLRYKPYAAKGGRHGGRTLFLPEGFTIIDDKGNKVSANDPSEEQKDDEKSKNYSLLEHGEKPEITYLDLSGTVTVTMTKDCFVGNRLEIDMGGASCLILPSAIVITEFLAGVVGAARLEAPITAK